MRAYALMQHAEALEAAYTASPLYQRAHVEIEAIRTVLPSPVRRSYRGIGRYPLTKYPERGPGWQGKGFPSPDPESAARALLLQFLGDDDYRTHYPRAFLQDAAQAKSVYAALCDKARYEIVELCTAPEHPRALLGFDVGYWGGGNFSILCDAAIWPLWHAPEPTALDDLARVLSDINEYGLFPAEQAATAYRDWYAGQTWAEQDPDEFLVIAVGSLSPTAS